MFGWTIGSSGAKWLEPHRIRKVASPPPPALPASCGPPGPLEALPALGPAGRPGRRTLPDGGPQATAPMSAAATATLMTAKDRRIVVCLQVFRSAPGPLPDSR